MELNFLVIFQVLFVFIYANENNKKVDVQVYLDKGSQLLSQKLFAEALDQFHLAIDADPSNYMSFYRRGTVYLALGKFKSALNDLNRVIELKKDFTSARLQQANILFKEGRFAEAIESYQFVLKAEPANEEAKSRLDRIYSILNELDSAKNHMESRDYVTAIDLYSRILESCPWAVEIHEQRSNCFLSIGELNKAVMDLNALAKLVPDNTKAYFKLTEIHYALGEAEYALNDVRECLKLDPDHKKCSEFYKRLRKLTKHLENMRNSHDQGQFDECIKSAQQVVNHDANAPSFIQKGKSYICICNSKGKHSKVAIDACTDYLKDNGNDAEALYYRGQAYIDDEQLEKAQADCHRSNEIENSQRAAECIDRINKLLKQRSKRDYYKILGVKRSADKNTIIKAYRKLAHKWHPDKYEGNDKDQAQKMFIDIAAAKEVLTDPEKRAKFDNGEDPLDPEEQKNQGFNPFQHGFNPFGGGGGGGGGFQFKFKFN